MSIGTLKCDKRHVLDLLEELNQKKFVNGILSLLAIKRCEANVNSFCMCKLLIKINIVQTQLWNSPFINFFLVFENNKFFLDRL